MDQQVHNSLFKILPQADCIQSALFVPLMNVDAPIGFLLLQRLGANPFDGQQSALTIFANQAVIAIQNAKLYQVSQELAVLEERHRVARDLHDSVSQTLFSSVVITEILSRSLNKKHDVIQSHLEDLETLNRSALAEMRLLLFELRPEQLLSTNLQDRVLQLIDATKGRKKLIFDIQIEPSPGIPSKVLAVFFRIIQESLNNIIKHSFARHVKIQLHNLEDQLHLTVQDDGVGFNMDEAKSGFGFSSMSERAQEIGADLKVISEPQHGTQVSLIWKKP